MIEEQYLGLLRGEKFDKGLRFPLQKNTEVEDWTDRLNFLVSLAKGKSVLHWGCCDHLPLIEDKIRQGQWLHGLLTTSAAVCHGLDIDGPALSKVRDLGFQNVSFIDDRMLIPTEVLRQTWDYIIAGEVLEHVSEPLHFLSGIKKSLGNRVDKIVLTVPNAFRYQNFANCLSEDEIECINSDHRFWFTPYTVAKIATDAGLKPLWFGFVNAFPLAETEVNTKYIELLRRHSSLREVLVFCAALV